MLIYILLFILIVCNYLFEANNNKNSQSKNFAVCLGLALFVGLGDMLGGYDRYIYGALFDEVADNIRNGLSLNDATIIKLYGNEPAYLFSNYLIGIFTRNRYIFIFIITLAIYFNVFLSIKKYSTNYALSTILFMGLMFFFTFTYLRQVLAASIVWLSFQSYIDRKPIRFCTLVCLAVCFHNSAILAAPLYFIPNKKYTPQIVITILGLSLLIGLSPLPSSLFDTYGESVDETRAQQYVEDTSGFRIAYLLEAVIFSFFLLRNYSLISQNEKDKRLIAFTNIAFIFCCTLLFFVKSENGGRLSWYFIMGPIIAFTYICTLSPRRSNQTLFILTLSAILFLRILNAWSFNMCPYKTFLTPGHTAAEWIYDFFEYDTNYDIDKFYR